MAVSGTDLYAGGHFTMADGVAVNRIAQWNDSHWSPLGSGMGAPPGPLPVVNALAVLASDLYVGDHFTTAGGKVSAHLARVRLSFTPDNLAFRANCPWASHQHTHLRGRSWLSLRCPVRHEPERQPVVHPFNQ